VNGLADWAELQAIASARQSCVIGDIERFLKPDDLEIDHGYKRDADESQAIEVIDRCFSRSKILGSSYPFHVDTTGLKPKDKAFSHEVYLFCLLLAGLRPEEISPEARHFFEIESKVVLHDYFGGEAFHFGWTSLNATQGNVQRRIEQFCKSTSLKWKARNPVLVSPDRKDIGIDAIIWKQSDDGRDNAFVALAQCASGSNWDHKLASAVDKHLNDCLEISHSGPIVKCFITSFHVPDGKWRESAQAVDGLIFDRLRMVLESGVNSVMGKLFTADARKWMNGKLKKLSR
jgi:hypothetical protein